MRDLKQETSSFDGILVFYEQLKFGPRREKTCLRGFCEQNKRRSACASPQSDQHLCYSLLESIIRKLATGEISIF